MSAVQSECNKKWRSHVVNRYISISKTNYTIRGYAIRWIVIHFL